MKKIAIIGAGPTGVYTLFSLLKNGIPLALSLYEQADKAGVGMPYSDEENSKMMLANIASIEIPPIFISYIDWLRNQSEAHLARYHVHKDSLHERQFLPRMLLGEYFRDRFLALLAQAKACGFVVEVHESCRVTDLQALPDGVLLWTEGQNAPEQYDTAVIATGHVWPEEDPSTRSFFPSPWSGLMEASIPPCNVGIMGTSLSGIDAAMAVAIQHGTFTEQDDNSVQYGPDKGSKALKIALMSRSGILPEADFYCPIPWEPLLVVTESTLNKAIAAGSEGLLDRVFQLMVQELEQADPQWSERIALQRLNADSFSEAWFADRKARDPFRWAQANLAEVEHNKRDRLTVPWRYTVLRLHEAIEPAVEHLNARDRKRFNAGLARVFIDNYAAIPPQSIRRLLALREAGIACILALGPDYKMEVAAQRTLITVQQRVHQFDVFIDARGQKAMKTKDLPFPTLRQQLMADGKDVPPVDDNYFLLEPASVRGRIALGALPWLMHNRPFVQGLTVCAEIGEAIARTLSRVPDGSR
ncbi:putative NAD(P)/FAD-binding protein YdhS [Enterobacter sp. BIGb0383]|uniref:FAD-NAD(P)-binding protein n=1 Tax=unclassified Enterobacter TaxID=2608935 RepID=UPI000F4A4409|nr:MULTISPECIES: FAD-NAD(P)-binding protein [unclassified Enterobacter]ROP50082.1 putative NAD(P)/FAD-binding protein YdhS [Enterobacter sp. BIGb0383]ROS06175.1 putative NAD(P)/FAD-binding protein YdhS [Enterobacter sp. BIGb0359]